MTSSDKRVFDALQRAGERMLQCLQHPDDGTLLQLHFTLTEAAIQDLGEIFVTPLERRDLFDLHISLLQVSRIACPLSASMLEAARQTAQLLSCLSRPQQARSSCQKIYRLLWKRQAVNQGEKDILQALLFVCQSVMRAALQ